MDRHDRADLIATATFFVATPTFALLAWLCGLLPATGDNMPAAMACVLAGMIVGGAVGDSFRRR